MFRRALEDLSALKADAYAALANRDPSRAKNALEIAVVTLVRLRKYLPLGNGYRELLGAHSDLFELAARIALQEGEIQKVLFVLEAVRASGCFERLRMGAVRSGKPAAISQDLLRLDGIRRQIWSRAFDTGADTEESMSLVRAHDELMAKLFTQEPSLPVDLKEERQLEGSLEVLVNILVFGVFDSCTFVVLKRPHATECECWLLELEAATVHSLVQEYRIRLYQVDGRALPDEEHLTRISRALTGGAIDRIDVSFPTCIIPHGPLHDFPFSAIRHQGAWLGERVELFSVPSVSMLHRRSRPMKLSGRHVVAIAYPGLPGAEDYLDGAASELGVVRDAFPQATCRTGSNATAGAFLRLAPEADLLHIACHAFLDAESSLLSCLALAPENESTGKVTVAQLQELSLRASLVIVSGCQTSRGEHTVWDDTVGVAQACLMAGAEAVVGAIWYLSDESTLEIMTRFYENVRAGETFSQALFFARREQIQKGRPPYEWSPFILVGHGAGDWCLGSASRPKLTVR